MAAILGLHQLNSLALTWELLTGIAGQIKF